MAWEFEHAVLFTGHMIDAPGRVKARFPPSAESAARAAILRAVATVIGAETGGAVGIAGGASGGDILFHEACFELGIATRLYLALSVEAYLKESVAAAGEDWVRRFYTVVDRAGVSVLDDSVPEPSTEDEGESGAPGESKSRFPSGMTNQLGRQEQEPAGLNVWARTNLWMVEEAIRIAERRTLIALWDGKGGDGPGGTAHLVEAAPGLGIEVAPVIAMQALLAGGE